MHPPSEIIRALISIDLIYSKYRSDLC